MAEFSDLLSKIVPLLFPLFSGLMVAYLWFKNRALRQSEIDILKLKQTAESQSLTKEVDDAVKKSHYYKEIYEKTLNDVHVSGSDDKP